MKKLVSGNFSSVSDAELITATLGSFPTNDLDKPPKAQKDDKPTDDTVETQE